MINIRLDIQYKGTPYSGWQVQPKETTVQGLIEQAIEKVTGQKTTLYAAGRTDAGVHALGQVANFRTAPKLPPEKYREALNFYLPAAIRIMTSAEVPDEFHARKSARWRRYRYIVGDRLTALYHEYRWEYPHPLDMERMNRIAAFIRGRHDFAAFCRVSSQKEVNDCDVLESRWNRVDDTLVYEVKANRFLHTMVRSLVGTMVDAGRDRDYLTLESFQDIMDSLDHTRIKTVAPARGLYLLAVGY